MSDATNAPVAVVTGAARGIGLAIAQWFLPRGWRVDGGLVRQASVDVRPYVRVNSPDGAVTVALGDSKVPPFAVPNAQLDYAGFGEGTWYSPGYGVRMLVRRFRRGVCRPRPAAPTRRGRALTLLSAGLALIATPAWVLLDEYLLDWTAWLPTWPSLISNGLIPLAVIAIPLILLDEWVKKSFHSDTEERVLFIVTFIFTAFVILTIIGIFFRGPGMALVLPWNMPAAVH